MRRSMTAVASLAALMLMAGVGSASQFMNITFDGDSLGAAPSTGVAGSPITTVQAIGGYNTSPTPTWDPGYQSPPTADCGTIAVGNVAGMNKGAVMTTDAANGEMGALWMDTGFAKTSSQLSLSFDINVLAAPANVTVQPKLLNNTADTVGILFGINNFGSFGPNGKAFMFAAAPTSATGGVFAIRSPDNTRLMTFGDYVNGQTYNITLAADYTTGVANEYINGSLVGTAPFWAAGVAAPSTTNELFMFLNGQSGYSNQVAIDNIQAFDTLTPEPATMALLAIGSIAGLLRRRAHKA
jgi:hypothetical protein